jgi:hypothetical protein
VHSHILLSIPGQLVSLVDSSFVLFTNPISFDSGFGQKRCQHIVIVILGK